MQALSVAVEERRRPSSSSLVSNYTSCEEAAALPLMYPSVSEIFEGGAIENTTNTQKNGSSKGLAEISALL